jgi:hypothetical protein
METKLGDVTATGTATVSWPEDEKPEAEEPQEQEAEEPRESE